jgi:formate dehydrogenase iron-sulfur subunit
VTLRLYLPRDAAAVAVGADDVAKALVAAAQKRKVSLDIVRTGSRGLFWLEPMLEVETAAGRIAYGPVTVGDVETLLDAIVAGAGPHPLHLGRPEEIPFLKRQTRLTFARCGIVDPLSVADYRQYGGYRGLEKALKLGPEATVEEVVQSGLRGRGGAFRPASSGRRCCRRRARRNTSCATPTKATQARSPTA